jgi:hypothetical protein
MNLIKADNTHVFREKVPNRTEREIVMNKVNQTTPKTFGCEVINTESCPDYRFLLRDGHRTILKVPVRKSGITSWGKAFCCHFNCNTLLHWVGGKVLRGYWIHKTGSEYKLDFHSVWITPEGRAVCVTRYPGDENRDFRLFVPIYESSLDDPFIIYPEIDVKKLGGRKFKIQLSALNSKAKRWEIVVKFTKKSNILTRANLKKTAMSLASNKHRIDVPICSHDSIIESFTHGGFTPYGETSRWNKIQERFIGEST